MSIQPATAHPSVSCMQVQINNPTILATAVSSIIVGTQRVPFELFIASVENSSRWPSYNASKLAHRLRRLIHCSARTLFVDTDLPHAAAHRRTPPCPTHMLAAYPCVHRNSQAHTSFTHARTHARTHVLARACRCLRPLVALALHRMRSVSSHQMARACLAQAGPPVCRANPP